MLIDLDIDHLVWSTVDTLIDFAKLLKLGDNEISIRHIYVQIKV